MRKRTLGNQDTAPHADSTCCPSVATLPTDKQGVAGYLPPGITPVPARVPVCQGLGWGLGSANKGDDERLSPARRLGLPALCIHSPYEGCRGS